MGKKATPTLGKAKTKKKKRVKPFWSGVRFYKPDEGLVRSLSRQDLIPIDAGTIIVRRRTSNNLTPGALALLPAVLCGTNCSTSITELYDQ